MVVTMLVSSWILYIDQILVICNLQLSHSTASPELVQGKIGPTTPFMLNRWTLFWWVLFISTFLDDQMTHHSKQINSKDTNSPSGLTILYWHMYHKPQESKANEVLYNILYALLMKVICHHVEIDIRRKGAVKRKKLPEGQDSHQQVINKRMKKLMAAQTSEGATAMESKPKVIKVKTKLIEVSSN